MSIWNVLKVMLFIVWLPFKIFFILVQLLLFAEYESFRWSNPEKEADLSLSFGRGNPFEFGEDDDDYC